jgi:hypothetical protein
MLGFALAVVVAQASPVTIAPWGSFDGKTWAGIELGTPERDLKRQFQNAKTEIADPASLRLRSDRRDWIVTTVFTEQGGKGSVVGIAVERERDALASLETLKGELGEPDGVRYPDYRFEDWSIAYWKTKGIAAVVDRGAVRKVLMASPEALARRVDTLPTEAGRLRPRPLVEVGEIDIRPRVKMNDGTAETLIGFQMQRTADKVLRDYRGKGWIGERRARNTIVIDFTIEKKNDKEFRLEASGKLEGRTDLGNGYWNASNNDTVRDNVSVGFRVEPMIERVCRDLGDRADETMRRLAWQAEWRPFYGLARP